MAGTRSNRQPLSRDIISDAAYRMIDEKGIDAFTMRVLGDELGVSAMAFYGHFSSREELLSEVCARFMKTMDTDPVPGERWDDTLRRTMTSIHAQHRDHPNLGELTGIGEAVMDGLAPHTKKIVMLHLAQGMPKPIFSRAWAIIDAFMGGFFSSEIGVAKLEAGSFPGECTWRNLEEWELTVRAAYTEEAFASGIDIIIAGVRNIADPDPCEWFTPKDNNG